MSVAPQHPTKIRSAKPEDITQVHAIYCHYVLHTPTDMHHNPPSFDSFLAEYESLTSLELPYFVAVAPPYLDAVQSADEATTTSLEQQKKSSERILGFIHAFPFRGYKLGYSHTAELAIICHPESIKHGVGSALMKAFLKRSMHLKWCAYEVDSLVLPQLEVSGSSGSLQTPPY